MSTRVLTVNSIEGLAVLPLHDQWMETEGIRLSEDGVLTVPMRIERHVFDDEWTPDTIPKDPPRSVSYSYKVPRFRAALIVHGVARYTLEDRAEIGGGDVYDITYDGTTLAINCSMPVALTAQTSVLDMELVISDEIVDVTLTEVSSRGVYVTTVLES